MHAKPLVNLTRKDVDFEFEDEHVLAMATLKHLAETCPAIRPLSYTSRNEVVLAVDSSWMAVGYILSQQGDDGKRYPSRFGSITWNEREQRYSQAKLELYGLFRALKATRVFTIGVSNLVVEVDAKYIKGMINNPDIQPNATINRWIAGILLFDFTLRHVPGKDHAPADGLSRRPHTAGDPPIDEDIEDWIDKACSFAIVILNYQLPPALTAARTSQSHLHPIYTRIAPPRTHNAHVTSPTHSIHSLAISAVDIPRSARALERDEDLSAVREFLSNLRLPALDAPAPHLPASQTPSAKLIRLASRFFLLDGQLWRRHRLGNHQLVIPPQRRYALIAQAHDELGHKGIFTVRLRLLDRFWWPHLDDDVKWYIKSCHECQIRLMRRILIPATVAPPMPLFRKWYIDTFFMPEAHGFRYIVHARCSLSATPEADKLRRETAETLGEFIREFILCRYGAVEELVTDNAPQYIAAVEYLVKRYHIHHIRISPYNSRGQAPIERKHFDVRESTLKATDGVPSNWPFVLPSVLWAERVSIQKSTGYSPFWIGHGIEPTLPFDLAEGTYLAPVFTAAMSTEDLIARRAIMLQKRPEDLERVHHKVLSARWAAVRELEKKHASSIIDFDFKPGALVLVRNSKADKDLSKHRPRYLGPMVVLRRTQGGSYILAELDGAVSKLRYAAFRLLPYSPRDLSAVPVTSITEMSPEELEDATTEPDPRG